MFGVPIVGGRDKIVKAAEKYGVEEIIIAIPSISHESKREIVEICSHTSCKIKQLPGLYQIANGEVSIKQIRDVDIEDLLEREVVRVDIDMIAEYVKGKTVLVTGVGSIGSELARQLAAHYTEKACAVRYIRKQRICIYSMELIAKRTRAAARGSYRLGAAITQGSRALHERQVQARISYITRRRTSMFRSMEESPARGCEEQRFRYA